MNERSSLDIPGAEIYVGVVGGFYQSGWHSFASTRRPGVGREEVLIRVTVTRFLESAPILPDSSSFAHPLAERLHENGKVFILWRANWPNYSPLSRPGAVLRFVRETACIMFANEYHNHATLEIRPIAPPRNFIFYRVAANVLRCLCSLWKSRGINFVCNVVVIDFLCWDDFFEKLTYFYRFSTWKWFISSIGRGHYELLRFGKVLHKFGIVIWIDDYE